MGEESPSTLLRSASRSFGGQALGLPIPKVFGAGCRLSWYWITSSGSSHLKSAYAFLNGEAQGKCNRDYTAPTLRNSKIEFLSVGVRMKSEGVRPLSAAGDSRWLQTLPGVMSVDPASAGPDSLSRAVMPGPDRWSSPAYGGNRTRLIGFLGCFEYFD